MGEVNLINQIFQNLNLDDLLQCKTILDSIINREYVKRDDEVRSKSATDFVHYQDIFLEPTSVEYGAISSELVSLGLKQNGDHPVTQWLTLTGQDYRWESSSGHATVKHPVDFTKCPGMHKLMQDINVAYNVDLNSCLVAYYKKGAVKARLHQDDEEAMDQTQPMFCVSLGAQRSVEFCHNGNDVRPKTQLKIYPIDGSLYIMKPGCQKYFSHKVPVKYN